MTNKVLSSQISLPLFSRKLLPLPNDRSKIFTDIYDRKIEDLRISITDRCNLRCIYCLEPNTKFMNKKKLLSIEEYEHIAKLLIKSSQLKKIRITGGEPTTRVGLDSLIRSLGRTKIRDLAITTNGILLTEKRLKDWFKFGLDRITFSLDSLKKNQATQISRRAYDIDRIINIISLTKELGFKKTKVNVVIIKNVNDNEINDFCNLARELSIEIRFLEFMPLDDGKKWNKKNIFTANDIEEKLSLIEDLVFTGREHPSATSETWHFKNNKNAKVGIIAPVTRPFCGKCNRLRLTSDGKIRACLFSNEEWDISSSIKSNNELETLKIIHSAVYRKNKEHKIGRSDFKYPSRAMNGIGG